MQNYNYDRMVSELNAVTNEAILKYPGYFINYNVDVATLNKYVSVTRMMPDGKDYRRCTLVFSPCTPVMYDDVVYLVEMVKEVVDGQSTGD